MGGNSSTSAAVLMNTQGRLTPEQEKEQRQFERKPHFTCHAVCRIFSNIYGVWQSAAGGKIIWLAIQSIYRYIPTTFNKTLQIF